jgi:hypothetical protein
LHLLKSFIFSTTLSSILVGSTACSACGMPRRPPRAYDHRLKEQIIRAGDPDLFPDLEIPRSTAASWIRRGLGEVVSLDSDDGGLALRDRVAKLEQRVAMLTAILRLVLAAPRLRLQARARARPAKPKVGLRTTAPNEASDSAERSGKRNCTTPTPECPTSQQGEIRWCGTMSHGETSMIIHVYGTANESWRARAGILTAPGRR